MTMTLIKSNFPTLPGFTDFFDDNWLKFRALNGTEWMPLINVVDNEGNYEIEVVAPGMKKEDFEVTLEHGMLTISAETKMEDTEENKNYTRREFAFRSFKKNFTLPENVEEDKIVAKYENGILRLTLKKTEKVTLPKKMVTIK